MSKVYNKIVQSNTEPPKNDIWLKDGKFKQYGKEGWEDIGGSSIDESTPVKTYLDGTELVPIFDGENKAVNVNELIKNSKEVYVVDLDNYKTSEDFNNLKNAINSNKIISIDRKIAGDFEFGTGDGVKFINSTTQFSGYSHEYDGIYELSIEWKRVVFWEDGRLDIEYHGSMTEGEGTKFLSDDGSYKEIESVLYTAQTLTESQKTQARDNIGIEPLTPMLDHLVVSYLLNPYLVIADGEIPTEFVDNGELKYKYSNMYLISYNGNHYRPSNISVDGTMTFIADGTYYEVNVTQDDNSTTGYSWDIAEKTA